MYYYLMTQGCQMNLSDGERIHTVLKNMGLEETQSENEAQLAGIIACSVRQKAIDKVYNQVARWNREKDRRNLITFLTGCILPEDRERFLKLFDLVFPISEARSLPEMIRSSGIVSPASLGIAEKGIPKNENIYSLWNIQPDYQSEFEAFIPIQNGCDKFCSFCAVPYTRGREVSRPSGEILLQLKELIEKDYKSITLLGQNVNSYGQDKPGKELTFVELLRAAGEMALASDKACWIYFTSPHPRDMTPEVIDVMASFPNLAKQVHLPMQSGDDKILARMNRGYSMERYREIVAYIRKKLPGATLFTDIIVGFSGESEEQHLRTAGAMEEIAFNMAYVAKYSPRPGAASYRWEDTVAKEVKKQRMHHLDTILEKTATTHNRKLIGHKLRVLVTGSDRKPGFMKGLTEGRTNIRFPGSSWVRPGTFLDIEVNATNGMSLEGTLLPQRVHSLATERSRTVG
jgi:tRNA-2-methylthio-N6-dimethylallyladenosine synthase